MVDIIFLHFKLHVGQKNRKYFSNTSRHCDMVGFAKDGKIFLFSNFRLTHPNGEMSTLWYSLEQHFITAILESSLAQNCQLT